jgi:hypothetical protein
VCWSKVSGKKLRLSGANSMSKTNPKTIADLKINWFFDEIQNFDFFEFEGKFNKTNPEIKSQKIIYGDYTFWVNKNVFTFQYYNNTLIWSVMDDVIYCLFEKGYKKVPEKFEYLGNNEFRIHLKK